MERGPFSWAQLRNLGFDQRELRRQLASGELIRVAHGWFAKVGADQDAVRALRLGGRLGCLSACKAHRLWVPPTPHLHVVHNPGAPLPRGGGNGVQFHRLTRPCRTAVTSVADSVDQVLCHHDEETALIVLESAVHRGLLHEADARHLAQHGRGRGRRTAQHFSPLAQSGSETRLRLFLQRKRVPVQPQAWIPGIGAVDLLVGRSWILEADSAQFHSSPRHVDVDCARDQAARELGFARDRLSFQQIWLNWDSTQRFLLSVLRTRRHLNPPVPLR